MIALSETTEQLARVLARKAGRTPDEVISQALEERARAAGIPVPSARPKTPEEKIAAMKATSDRCAALPVLDDRTPDDIIGYDECGVPK